MSELKSDISLQNFLDRQHLVLREGCELRCMSAPIEN